MSYPLFEIGDSVQNAGGRVGRVIEHVDGAAGLTEYVVEYHDDSETATLPEYALEFADPVEDDYESSDEWFDDDYADSWSDYDSE